MKNELPYDVRVENEVLRRHQDVLINLTRRASEKVALDDFLQEVTLRVAEAIEIDRVKLMRYRPDRGDLFMEAGVGWRPGLVKTAAFPADMASPPGRAHKTAQPVAIECLAESPEFRSTSVLEEHGIVSVVNVPILVDGASWGVLEGDSSILRGFSADTINFMTACAALTGLVIRRVQAEEAQAQATAESALAAQKRELLLREMQHRVKNNFQTILAMISLQMKKFPTDEGRRIAARLAENIQAMALAHDQLSPTREGEVVQLRTYLEALVASIEKPFENVLLEVEAEDMAVEIDQAVPLGLVVNEAVTNAVKHAFDPEKGGAVRILLRPHGAGEAMLSIADNGTGIHEKEAPGSGLKLMEALARQLRGRVDRASSEEGTTVCLIFPRPVSTMRG
ncbi:MAG TPA: histidine kinase dimerization/phosphoacceptor domain -containing protein [Allosphingosinicella sp.]|nr:histidine kinase dimerization/phosphoacceptor domain -containing protein [Allosphingosinicella sp.]